MRIIRIYDTRVGVDDSIPIVVIEMDNDTAKALAHLFANVPTTGNARLVEFVNKLRETVAHL